jgi:hypothetical protein
MLHVIEWWDGEAQTPLLLEDKLCRSEVNWTVATISHSLRNEPENVLLFIWLNIQHVEKCFI